MKPKPLINLDDIADKDVTKVWIGLAFDSGSENACYVFESVCPEELGLKSALSDLSFCKYEHEGEHLILLLVAAGGATCVMRPRPCSFEAKPRLDDVDFRKTLAKVDGWLVATTTGDTLALCFSVVRKQRWVAAGSPERLDVTLAADAD